MTDDPVPRFDVIHSGAAGAVVEVQPGPAYPGFHGHFPGDPLLPGMCHIDLAVQAAGLAAGRRFTLLEVQRARFTRSVAPGETLRISLTWLPEDIGPCPVKVLHTVGEDEAAEFSLLLEEGRS